MSSSGWQNRFKDAFSSLHVSPRRSSTPPSSRSGNSSSGQYLRPPPPPPTPPQPLTPSQPLPLRQLPIIVRSLRLLEPSIVEAELCFPNGQIVLRRHNLDWDLGNSHGTFSFGDMHFSRSARNVHLHDFTLHAELGSGSGPYYWDKVGLEVDFPDHGKLEDIAVKVVEYQPSHSPSLLNEKARLITNYNEDFYNLRLVSGFVLAADCRQADGTYATSYIDLDAYLGNSNGRFKRGDTNFTNTSRNPRLFGTTLQAELGTFDHGWTESSIDVSRICRCANGRLVTYKIENPADAPPPVFDAGLTKDNPLAGCRWTHLVGKNVLVARCIMRGGRAQDAAFKLDTIFGFLEGRLRPFGSNFHHAREIQEDGIKLDGSILSVIVASGKDAEPRSRTETIDLQDFLENKGGTLVLKEDGPCSGCKKIFKASRMYSLMHGSRREKLDSFNVSAVDQDCALCKTIEGIIEATVPFVRSCEVFVEVQTSDKYLMDIIELEIIVNNINRRYRLYLDATTPTDSKAFGMMPLREHPESWLEPSQRWPILSSRIDDCFTNHDQCQRRGRPLLPSRCLDIGTQIESRIRLLTPQSEMGRYACLSHCWGHNPTVKLTSETFTRFQKAIPVEELPKTYRDAISVCRLLGLRYLWIDSLCILQDSKADWLVEAPKMIKYYGQCHICIAATNASGSNIGLDIANRPNAIRATGIDKEGISYELIAYPAGLVGVIPHFSRANKTMIQEQFPLMTRGWVLQERWLAPRTLHFCGKEVVFECTKGLKCECGHAEDPYLISAGGDEGRVMSIENMRDGVVLRRKRDDQLQWTQIVSAYSSLNLTFGTDHLIAISGLARDFAERHAEHQSCQYLAGLWRHNLEHELVWFVGEPLLRYRDAPPSKGDVTQEDLIKSPIAQNSKAGPYIAPSWSWASIFDSVKYRSQDSSCELLCQVSDSHIVLEGIDEFGSVSKGCYIQVQGQLARSAWSVNVHTDPPEHVLSDITGTQRVDRYESRGIKFLPDYTITNADQYQVLTNEELYMLPVTSQGVHLVQWSYSSSEKEAVDKELELSGRLRIKMCLVLRKLPGLQDSMHTYERVGFVEFANVRIDLENEDTNAYWNETFVML